MSAGGPALFDGTCQVPWVCYQFSSFKLKNWAHTRVCVDILQVTSVIERSSIGKMEELENCPCLNELHQALRWSVVRWLGGLSCIFLSADSDECLVKIIRYEFCRPSHCLKFNMKEEKPSKVCPVGCLSLEKPNWDSQLGSFIIEHQS